MIISHRYKFAVFNIPKTGTLSLMLTLSEYSDIINTTSPDDVDFYQHEFAYTAKRKFQHNNWDWDRYYKYIVIRNPWHRYASLYNWANSILERFAHIDFNSLSELNQNTYRRFTDIFNKFDYNQKDILKFFIKVYDTQDKFFLIDNQNSMDYIAQMENFQEEYEHFCNVVGMDKPPKLQHCNQSKPYDYKSMYNQELVDLVAEKEKYIIEHFNYRY